MPTPLKFGTEFLVNSTTADYQAAPSIVSLDTGRFVAAWQDTSASGGDPSELAVRAQVFNADGSKRGPELLLNTTTLGVQVDVNLTALAGGRFVAVWTDSSGSSDDPSSSAVRAQIFNEDGSKVGVEFLVPFTTLVDQHKPTITTLTDGRFVVAWQDHSAEQESNIRGQIFDADGTRNGAELLIVPSFDQLNPDPTVNSQGAGKYDPALTPLSSGGFVAIWEGHCIRGQIFDASGNKVGAEFQVGASPVSQQMPAITTLVNGRFVAAWTEQDGVGSYSVYGQVFSETGTKIGTQFLVDSVAANGQFDPTITALADGRFVAAWTDSVASGDDTSGLAVRAQVFDADGIRIGEEFLVNTTTTNDQGNATLSGLVDGRFVVAWQDTSLLQGDTSGSAVRAQIFDPRQPGITLTGTDLGDDWVGTSGIDTMQGLLGQDHLDGSGGIGDIASYAEKTASVVVTLTGAAWADVSVGGVIEDRIRNFEHLTGGYASDKLTGDSFDNTFVGGAGNDVLVTLDGLDRALGDEGNDYLYMGEGSDFADGGSGVDVLVLAGGIDFGHGGADQDYLFGGLGDDWLWGEDGVDVLHGEDGNDFIQGGVGNDYYYGGLGDDIAFEDTGLGNIDNDIFVMGAGADSAAGGLGQDYFYMGDGDDEAYGGDGVDVFLGEAGNDLFDGGSGVDYAWGGLGNDTYLVRSDSGVLVVQDFAAGGTDDAIRLISDTGITTLSGVLAASTYYAGMNTTIITIDADTAVWLVGVNKTQLTTQDFIF